MYMRYIYPKCIQNRSSSSKTHHSYYLFVLFVHIAEQFNHIKKKIDL